MPILEMKLLYSKNKYLIKLIRAITLILIINAVLLTAIFAQTTVIYSITASRDDAEEHGLESLDAYPGYMYFTSSDLEIVEDFEPSTSGTQTIGLRFNNILVPQGATVTNAYLTFRAISADSPNDNSSATNLVIKAQASDNAPAFPSTDFYLTNATKTSSGTNWSPSAWTTGLDYNSSAINNVVQEITDRTGWFSGNSMAFIITGTGSRSTSSWDYSGVPAQLTIEYETVPGATIGNFVWDDADEDGIQDAGELGIDNVTINLYYSSGGLAGTTTTNSSGFYSFSNIVPGNYYLDFILPSEHSFSPQDQGGNDNLDSDASLSNGQTVVTTLTSGENDPTWDAGMYNSGPVTHPDCNYLYAVADDDDRLVYMNRYGGSGAITIGRTNVTDIEATALSLDAQTLYAANANQLGTLNWNTGNFTALASLFGTGGGESGEVNFSDVDGLAFDPLSGILYGTHRYNDGSPEDILFQIDPLTGAHVPNAFGDGVDYVTIDTYDAVALYDVDDIAISPVDGQMYAVVNSSGGNDRIVKINKYTGDVIDVGRSHTSTANVNDVEGLAFHNSGTFYGTTGDTPETMYEIDVTNALFTLVHTMDNSGDYESVAGLTCGSNLISGNVFIDINQDGNNDISEIGQQGVTVRLYRDVNNDGTVDGGDIFVHSLVTDNNGDYEFEVGADGAFVIEIDQTTLPPSTSMTTDNVEEADFVHWGNSDENNDFGIYNEFASIGNYVWYDSNADGIQDAGETGLNNVTVNLRNSSGGLVATTTTDANGEYSFTGLTPGDFYLEFILLNGYLFSPQDAGNPNDDSVDSDANETTGETVVTTLSAHENDASWDTGMYLDNAASITGYVWDDDYDHLEDAGEGIKDLDVYLYDSSDNLIATTQTDDNGVYLFDELGSGDYYVEFTLKDNHSYSNQDVGSDDTIDSDPHPMTGRTEVFTLSVGEEKTDVDAGQLNNRGAIGDRVWNDVDADGIQDVGEPGLSNVTVQLYNNDNVLIGTTTTDTNGEYYFNGIVSDDYYVRFTPPPGYVLSDQNVGADDTVDSDPDPITGETALTKIDNGEIDPTWDAGMYQAASIGDKVWFDADNDGIQDASENGLPGVVVELYQSDGTFVGTEITGGGGYYSFTGLRQGDYYVKFLPLSGYTFNPQNVGSDDADSDANPSTGQTATTTLSVGENDQNWDSGLYLLPASLGNYVWFDDNNDGIQDGTESGISNVKVNLYEKNVYTTVNYDEEIQVGTDDAHQEGTTMKLTDNDLKYGKTNRTAGFRFTNLNIPAGAIINSAYLNWDHGEGGSKQTLINIYAEDSATPGTFTSTDDNIVDRTRTLNYVPMNVDVEGDGTDVTSPDLKSLVQSVVNSQGGIDHLALILIAPNDDGDEIRITSYEDSWDDANKDTPRLVVNYSYPTGYSIHSSKYTDGDGLYSFDQLRPGDYYVEFELVDDHDFSPQDSGSDDTVDSDADETTGLTIETTLISGENDPTWDAGMHSDVVWDVGDYVWNDDNHNGIQDDAFPGDPANGLENVKVTLYDGTGGTELATTYTNAAGWYEFTNLSAGEYQIEVDYSALLVLYPDLEYQTYDYDGILTAHRASFTIVDSDNFDLEFGYSDTPLPVKLTSFIAEISTNGVKLTWITESEDQNQGFIIHRKLDTETEWQEIANFLTDPGLRGQGSVTYQTMYEYLDSTVLPGFTYEYRLGDVDYNTAIMLHTDLIIRIEVDHFAIPDNFSLKPAYPNPFNPLTTISYSLPEISHVQLYIYDITGKLIKKLVNNLEQVGHKQIVWNGLNDRGEKVHSGVYLYVIQAGEYRASEKLILVR